MRRDGDWDDDVPIGKVFVWNCSHRKSFLFGIVPIGKVFYLELLKKKKKKIYLTFGKVP